MPPPREHRDHHPCTSGSCARGDRLPRVRSERILGARLGTANSRAVGSSCRAGRRYGGWHGREVEALMAAAPVLVEGDTFPLEKFYGDPLGPLGEELIGRLGEVVLEGAKRRALHKTGRMEEAMYSVLGEDELGLYADIISPVQNPQSGFPYAIMHEARKIRDRRPHRSLVPALRDIRNILTE